jgi:hypothetical protein
VKKRKVATSATSSASRSKKVKVLTRRPKRIETVVVPKLIEGAAPVTEPSRSMPVEARKIVTKEPELEKTAEQLKALSPPCAAELPKPSNIPTTTPRKRRMASVLDAVMESVKTSTPASAEALTTEAKVPGKNDAATMAQTTAETGPAEVPAEPRPSETAAVTLEKGSVFRNTNLLLQKLLLESRNSLFDMLRGSNYQKSRLLKCNIIPGI